MRASFAARQKSLRKPTESPHCEDFNGSAERSVLAIEYTL
jgi:hypothetical protein